jgi:hypothetical protein
VVHFKSSCVLLVWFYFHSMFNLDIFKIQEKYFFFNLCFACTYIIYITIIKLQGMVDDDVVSVFVS